jgi:hypothetical protein
MKKLNSNFFCAQMNSRHGVNLHRVLFISVFLFLSLAHFSVDAQLKRVPLQVKPKSKATITHHSVNARTADDSPCHSLSSTTFHGCPLTTMAFLSLILTLHCG